MARQFLTKLLAGAIFLAGSSQVMAGISCTVVPTTIWNTGYKLDILVKNDGPAAVSNWAVNIIFSESSPMTSNWNAVFTGTQTLRASNLSWNGNLAVNASTPIGLTGNHDGTFVTPICVDANASSSASSIISSSSSVISLSSRSSASSLSSPSSASSVSSRSSVSSLSSPSSASSLSSRSSVSSLSSQSSASSLSSRSSVSSLSSQSSVSSTSSRSSTSSASGTVNVDRSLFVHDIATLAPTPIRLVDVMNQLATQMNAINTAPAAQINGTQLFGRMWNQQRSVPAGGNCTGTVNGWSIACRNVEGAQASTPELHINSYQVIGLVNRFDLRDKATFNDCGEYRAVFGRNDGQRNFIIFEAQVPNPTPGVASGCRPIQQFWQGLTTQSDPIVRSQLLRNFYFNGLPASNVRAPIDIRNYSQTTGQIRTNQFMEPVWLLKEYKVSTASGVSTLNVVSDKSNPVADLFNVNNTDPRAAAFRTDFIDNLPSLLAPDLSTFSLTVENDAHNNGQSHASGNTSENDFLNNFVTNSRGSSFETAIRNKLVDLRSPLTVDQVINRATAMTCGGCHQPSFFALTGPNAVGPGQSWPDSGFFVHVNENTDATGSFPLSPALLNVFLPARKLDMETFLNAPAQTPAAGDIPVTTNPVGKRSG